MSTINPLLVAPPHVDQLLDEVCKHLHITRTQFENAVSSYSAVAKWLNEPGTLLAPYRPAIYPQGSMALLTTVRPLKGDEFDVDLVCQLAFWFDSSKALYAAVGQRLAEYEVYRRMLEPKNRCWTLNYKGDFHMDVLPAKPDEARGDTSIWVPDRKLNDWSPSNPLGYIAWFNDRVALRRLREAKRANVPPLPEPDPFEAPETLRKVVQLMKRHRDVRFADDQDHAPRSIVLTTLAATYYTGLASTAEALLWILSEISAEIQRTPGVMKVLNPANPDENFAEKWEKEPEAYHKFVSYIDQFASDLYSLLNKPIAGGLGEGLEKLFGQAAATHALDRYAEGLERAREQTPLRYSPALGLTFNPIGTRSYRTNTNFGADA